MNTLVERLAVIALLGGAALPALAASSTSSAASDGVSTSVGSLSTSVQKSSDSSTKGTNVAEGDYKVIDIAEAQPGTVRLTLRPVADGGDGEFFLYLPQEAAAQNGITAGQVVSVRQRAYGLEFAQARQPFFLVLADDWYRELQTRVVEL